MLGQFSLWMHTKHCYQRNVIKSSGIGLKMKTGHIGPVAQCTKCDGPISEGCCIKSHSALLKSLI